MHYTQTVTDGLSLAEQWLLASVGTPRHILDIGCGAGRVAVALAQIDAFITAVDISHELLMYAQHYAHVSSRRIHVVHVDALSLPFRPQTFDLAIAMKVYCYIPTKIARLQYLHEITRILRPGGILALTQYVTPPEWIDSAYDDDYHRIAPSYTTLEVGDTFAVSDHGQTHAYVHWFTSQSLHEELAQTGLSLIIDTNDKDYGGEGYIQLVALQKSATD